MHRPITLILMLLVLLWVGRDVRADDDWRAEKQKESTRVFSRAVASSDVREIRGTTEVSASVKTLAVFLQDPETNPQWVPHSRFARILARPAPDSTLVHFVMQASWPFQARDAVALFRISQTPSFVVHIRFDSQSQLLPEEKNVVRLLKYAGYWQLTPAGARHTSVVYQSYVDAGGQIPAWLANSVAIKSTFTALENLRAQVPLYQMPRTTPLDFLQIPADQPTTLTQP